MTTIPDQVLAVRAAWADVLAVDEDAVPMDTSFFDAGGNSMLLLLLWEELAGLTERDLKPVDLFDHRTVRAQADLLAAG